MKEQLINETCMMFIHAFPDIDLERVRSVLAVSLDSYEVNKVSKDVTVYKGEPNEIILKNFLVAKRVNGMSEKTIKHYAFILGKAFNRIGKNVLDITTNDLRVYFAKREIDDNVSAVTRNNERRVMNSFFGWLRDEGYVNVNPASRISRIKEKKVQKKAFEQIEIELIRDKCKNYRESAIIEVLISTGCRVSELCGIKVDEVEGDTIIIHGKGNKDRMCYLTPRASVAIDNYKKSEYYQKRHELGSPYLFMGRKFENDEYMSPMAKSSIEGVTKRIGARAGVDNCHPHRFRRTCATMALNHGMPIEQVSKMLGHESLETTKIYLDLSDESLKNAHKKYVM